MDLTKATLLKTFNRTTDADAAAGQLRRHGIECAITTDDCGGMYPPLGIIKLLVNPADGQDAREILRAQAEAVDAPVDEQKEIADSGRPVSPPRVYRFNSGLIVGLFLGALLHFSYTYCKQHRNHTARYDWDRDGVPDEEIVWRDGHMVEARLDSNGDGRSDQWAHYSNDVLLSEEVDENLDGRPDYWIAYSPKRLVLTSQFDSDFNGIPDFFTTYTNGVTKQMDWRPNGTNVVLRRQLFRNGVLDEELRDLNGDGLFDIRIKFDSFWNPISTNNLRPASMMP